MESSNTEKNMYRKDVDRGHQNSPREDIYRKEVKI